MKGNNISVPFLTALSSIPRTVKTINPDNFDSDLFCSADEVDDVTCCIGFPRSNLLLNGIPTAMKKRPRAPTIHREVRHVPNSRSPAAAAGASILPKSPAKFTVPTADDLPEDS